ncbi:ABC transporter substrate-binding protein [Ligaoa zhengdingensis]|uniref:ABC transporter substrate-binding protein n=4 Tax=Ligaoa zhengdingensis TaxID=2763658 RepID=UPI0031BA2FB5
MMKRFLALLLALAALFCSGCMPLEPPNASQDEPQQSQPQEPTESAPAFDRLKIAYNSANPLEPYSASSTMNLNLIPLMYDPLVKLDQNYEVHKVLAEEIRMTGDQCIVTVRSGVTFSDGAPLTADDVVYSAQQVLAPGNSYSGLLSNVKEVAAVDSRTVQFTLNTPDRLFANLLTFPIVAQERPGVGSGRYVLAGSGENLHLEQNPRWYGGTGGRIKTIELINQLDQDTLIYSLKLGTINYVYSDLADNETATIGSSTQLVPLNNLVYLGVNSTKAVLADARMRKVLDLCLDRAGLAESAYAARALPAYTPFQPNFSEVQALDLTQPQDLTAAALLMEQLGYSAERKDAEGYYVIPGRGRFTLRLLVNAENSGRLQIATELQRTLREFGIELVIDSKKYEDYQNALAKWDFDLYLAEVKLYDNMDISRMLSPAEKLGFGVTENETLLAANAAFRSGAMGMEEFVQEFGRSLPFLPILYRSGTVSFSRGWYFESLATEQDIFYNIENW